MARRGRPAGSKNKSKTSDQGIGSNSALTDDEKRALALHHAKGYRKALDAKKAADAALKNLAKLAKADGVGDEMKALVKAQTPEGQEEIKRVVEASLRAMKWAGVPVGGQMDLFADNRDTLERARAEGKTAGMSGEDQRPPAGLAQDAANEWLAGWHDGQAALASALNKRGGDNAIVKSEEDEDDAWDEDDSNVIPLHPDPADDQEVPGFLARTAAPAADDDL